MDRPRPLTAAAGLAVGVACILHASTARAEGPCASGRPGGGVPVRVPIFAPADFAVPQEACARTSVSIEGRMGVLVAESDFYGSVLAGLALRATLKLGDAWVSAWVPGLEYRFVANATVEKDATSLGAGALGLHVPIARGRRYQLVAYGRALVPTETIFVSASRYGAEPGLTGLLTLGPKLELLGSLSSASLFTVTPGRVSPEWAPALATDLVYRPSRGFGVALGAGLRPLASFDPHAQLRFYPYRGLQISLGAVMPIGGRDRTNLAGALSIGWDGL